MRESVTVRRRFAMSAIVASALLFFAAAGLRPQTNAASGSRPQRQEGVEAFRGIAMVLRNPRCMNCHPRGNVPRQGDDRHPHANLLRRGPDGKGVPGQLCSTCHQAENNAASGAPGKPDWHLAPLSMGWEGLSDAQLCRELKDPRRNGGRDLKALEEHIAGDPLVAYGWDPGATRKPIPIPREEVVQLMTVWSRAGAPCPSPVASR